MTHTISVGFFKDTLINPLFSDINDLVIKIMEAGNVKVTDVDRRAARERQNTSADEFDMTLELAMEQIEACEQHGFDYIIDTIGGSRMPLKDYDKLFVPGTAWHKRAKSFTGKVREISEIMHMARLEFKHDVERNAVYQSPDQMEEGQSIFDEPVEIIKQIPGLNYIEMKREEVQTAKPDLIITSHPGRSVQTKSGIDSNEISEQVEVKHIVEVVAESCGVASNQ